MKLVILTFVLVLSLPYLAAAADTTDAAPTPRGVFIPIAKADQPAAPVQTQRLISPYSVIRYDQPAQPVKPAPVVSAEPELPQFAPYRSTSRSKQFRPAYLP